MKGQIIQKESELKDKITFRPSTDPAERMAQETRAREFRDQIKGLDPLQRSNMHSLLASQGSLFELWALESAPLVVGQHPKTHATSPGYHYATPMVSESDKLNLAVRRIGAEFPDEVETLKELKQLADSWDGIVNSLTTAIGPVDDTVDPKPAPAPDPLEALSRMGKVDAAILSTFSAPHAPLAE